MKTIIKISIVFHVVVLVACQKNKSATQQQIHTSENYGENYGPYGNFSKWKSIGGDTLFSDTLTLSHFFTEKTLPCDVCYYQQNYSLWNDYDYTLSASKCQLPKDTLVIQDPNTNKKAIFIHLN